jgi:hypothetical protein
MADRFNPGSLYVIPGNILNIVWEEVCQPYLAIARSPIKEQLESRLGMILNNAIEDTSGRSRYHR